MKPGTRERRQENRGRHEKNLGARGVPGAPAAGKMTPQEDKNIPTSDAFDGHAA